MNLITVTTTKIENSNLNEQQQQETNKTNTIIDANDNNYHCGRSQEEETLIKSINKKTRRTTKRKKAALEKQKRKRHFSDTSHKELVLKMRERYGETKRSKDEFKEPMLNTCTKEVLHPPSYQRMMGRATEAYLNRLLQPEPPDDLLPSNWICALCFKPPGADYLGELFGPYFVRLSPKCQPPELLVPRKSLLEYQKETEDKNISDASNHWEVANSQPSSSGKMSVPSDSDHKYTTKPNKSPRSRKGRIDINKIEKRDLMLLPLVGSLDIWMHGSCALWAPELYLVGGRFPTLQLYIQDYWQQTCIYCHQIGATIPIIERNNIEPETSCIANEKCEKKKKNTKSRKSTTMSKKCRYEDECQQQQEHTKESPTRYSHYACAREAGCSLDEYSFRCGQPNSF